MFSFDYNNDIEDSYSLHFAKEFYKIVDKMDAKLFGSICDINIVFNFSDNIMQNRENVIKGLTIFYNSISNIKHEIDNSWHIILNSDVDIFFLETHPNYKPDANLDLIINPSAMTYIKYNKKTKLIVECSIYIDNTELNEFNKNKNKINMDYKL